MKLTYFTEHDFQRLIDWIPDAKFMMQWGGPAFHYPLTHEQLADYLEEANTAVSTKYVFNVLDNEDKVIGHISFKDVDRNLKCARIGKVLIGENVRGNGYGTKMMNTALAFAFEMLQLEKVTLGVFDFNTSAIRCYEKVRFQQQTFLKDARQFEDEYWSLIEMAISAEEWKQARI